MNVIEIVFDVTAWFLVIYIIAALVLFIRYMYVKKKDAGQIQKIQRWIGILNIVFVCWFLASTIYDIVKAEIMKEYWGSSFFELDASTIVYVLSAFIFLAIALIKKYRRSPYSLVVITGILVINLIIAFNNVAIVV